MFCTACGGELPSEARFCPACGSVTQPRPEARKVRLKPASGLGAALGAALLVLLLAAGVLLAVSDVARTVGQGEATARPTGDPSAATQVDQVVVSATGTTVHVSPAPRSSGMLPPGVSLASFVMGQRNLPAGFVMDKNEPMDNRAVARASKDPDASLRESEEQGRVDGYRRTFKRDGTWPKSETITVKLSRYRDEHRARSAFQHGLAELRQGPPKSWESEMAGWKVTDNRELSGATVGDDSFIWRFRASGAILGAPATIDVVPVYFRRGNMLATVGWDSIGQSVLLDELMPLARVQDARILDGIRLAAPAGR